MGNCEYRTEINNHHNHGSTHNKKYCMIDHRVCEYDDELEGCPTYRNFVSLSDDHVLRAQRLLTKKGIKNLASVVININLGTK